MALSRNGVAELRVKKEVEKVADGGTEEDLAYLDVSSSGTCLGTDDERRALVGGRNDFVIPVIYL